MSKPDQCNVGEWWREKGNGVVHRVARIPGSKGYIGESVCGRYVGPQYGDTIPERQGRKYCKPCREGRRGRDIAVLAAAKRAGTTGGQAL